MPIGIANLRLYQKKKKKIPELKRFPFQEVDKTTALFSSYYLPTFNAKEKN